MLLSPQTASGGGRAPREPNPAYYLPTRKSTGADRGRNEPGAGNEFRHDVLSPTRWFGLKPSHRTTQKPLPANDADYEDNSSNQKPHLESNSRLPPASALSALSAMVFPSLGCAHRPARRSGPTLGKVRNYDNPRSKIVCNRNATPRFLWATSTMLRCSRDCLPHPFCGSIPPRIRGD